MNTNSEEDWRQFRLTRNKYNNLVKSTKNNYYSDKLTVKSKKEDNNVGSNNINNKVEIKQEYTNHNIIMDNS